MGRNSSHPLISPYRKITVPTTTGMIKFGWYPLITNNAKLNTQMTTPMAMSLEFIMPTPAIMDGWRIKKVIP